jgi:hypothetical protein
MDSYGLNSHIMARSAVLDGAYDCNVNAFADGGGVVPPIDIAVLSCGGLSRSSLGTRGDNTGDAATLLLPHDSLI